MIPYAPRERFTQPNRISDLILRAAESQADSQLRSGQIWGNAVRGIGGTVADAVGQYGEQKAEQKRQDELSRRDQAALSVMSNPDADPMEFLRIYGPRDGVKVAEGFQAFKKIGAGASQSPEDLYKLYGGLNTVSEKVRAAAYPTIVSNISKSIPALAGALPAEYSPEGWSEIGSLLGGMNPQDQKLMEVSPNATLFDPRTKTSVFTAPPAPAKPGDLTPEEAATVAYAQKIGKAPEALTYEERLAARKGWAGADDKPPDPVAQELARLRLEEAKKKPAITPTMEANIVNRLNTQWSAANKTSKELNNQVRLMDAGLEAAKRGDLAQGAQAVLVTFQKILDPTSVVRESEFARSAAGQSVFTRIEGAFEKLRKGGAGVPLDELKKFADLAREAVKAQQADMPGTRKRISSIADRYGIPHELIFDDAGAPVETAPKPESQASPSGGRPGAFPVMAPDGKTYTFPTKADADAFKKRAGIK